MTFSVTGNNHAFGLWNALMIFQFLARLLCLRNNSELLTTLTDDIAIAAPAITGLSIPDAAAGMAMTL